MCIFSISVFAAGCSFYSPDKDQAEAALRSFFDALNQGDYATAAELYSGSYAVLREYNPDLDPADHPALWERACTMNGFQCLLLGEIIPVEATGKGEITLRVEFLTRSGEVFFLGPCCGADETSMPPVSEFEFRVSQDDSGQYKVLDLPVYVP
jgi:hypothetical protein